MVHLSTDILTVDGECSFINWSSIAWTTVQETDILLRDLDLPVYVHLPGYFVRPRGHYLLSTVYPSPTDEALEWFSVVLGISSLDFVIEHLNRERKNFTVENSSKWVRYIRELESLRFDLNQYIEAAVYFQFNLSI